MPSWKHRNALASVSLDVMPPPENPDLLETTTVGLLEENTVIESLGSSWSRPKMIAMYETLNAHVDRVLLSSSEAEPEDWCDAFTTLEGRPMDCFLYLVSKNPESLF